jgi:hypothetical protein
MTIRSKLMKASVGDDESLVAVDFLSKLDPKRFTSMLTVLRNNAAINLASYPTSLAGAYRAASAWTSDGLIPATRESLPATFSHFRRYLGRKLTF